MSASYNAPRWNLHEGRDAALRQLPKDPTGGLGTSPMDRTVLGPNTFGHGAASSATIRIDPDNHLVVVMTRNSAGKNFDKYHPRFLKLIADVMENPVLAPPATAPAGK